jgi:hypothetical protein
VSPSPETEVVGDTIRHDPGTERNAARTDSEIQKLDFHLRPASLEDVFLKLAGRELRD